MNNRVAAVVRVDEEDETMADSTIRNRLQPDIAAALDQHAQVVRPFYQSLQAQAARGFNAVQFATYRANYFYRTSTTASTIAFLAMRASAMDQRDWTSFTYLCKNAYEESGMGNPEFSHRVLLERSHNGLGTLIYGLPALTVDQADDSPLILAEARAFRETQQHLIRQSYPTALGASCAQENAASGMMQAFFDAFFLPQHPRLAGNLALVDTYFTVHLNGVEQEHGEHAHEAVLRVCRTASDAHDAMQGVHQFLNAQANLWRALQQAIEAATNAGPVVAPL